MLNSMLAFGGAVGGAWPSVGRPALHAARDGASGLDVVTVPLAPFQASRPVSGNQHPTLPIDGLKTQHRHPREARVSNACAFTIVMFAPRGETTLANTGGQSCQHPALEGLARQRTQARAAADAWTRTLHARHARGADCWDLRPAADLV
eukprot:4706492-Alexandrium_andersonii.AAC.1